MNDLKFYESIPEKRFPIILHDYKNEPYDFPLHWHGHIEIHYIFEGEGTLSCAGRTIDLKENDCAVINGNELHRGEKGKCSYACILIPISFLGEERVLFDTVVRSEEVGRIFREMYEVLRKKEKGYELSLKSYTYLLLFALTRHHAREEMSEHLYDRRAGKLEKINAAVQYIDEHFCENILTSDLARMTHLSEGYFCNLFREVTGKTAKEYMNTLRIKRAEDLLENTDMTVTEIAFLCGFSDANYFTRIFKKEKEKSPRAFRRKQIRE